MKKYGVYVLIIVLLLLLLTAFSFNEPISSLINKGNSSDLVTQENIIMFPEPNGLIQVQIDTLGEPLPETKDEGDLPVVLTFTAGGTTLNTYGEIKVQGTSTEKWPKKNWTLKFYDDKNRSELLRLKIGDSVASDKWVAKAEWVDPTMLRNALSYRLWEAMVKSRDEFPQYEVDHAWFGQSNMSHGVQTGAQGFPKSHPVHIKVNGEHYGISMLLLGHDPRNFNIDKDNPEHIYMEFDARGGYTEEKTWEKFSSEGIGEWIDGYYPKNQDLSKEQLAAIDELGNLINGPQSDFEKNFDKHLDKTNMIDMLLFLEAIYDYDAVAQDVEMVTYDSEKWYLLPWDKDTTFGMDWNERGIREESATKLLINYQAEDPSQKPWYKTYHTFRPDVEARYAQLRDENIFSAQGLYELTGGITKKIPREIWEAELDRWAEDKRPSLNETSTSQVITWFGKRLEMLDKHFHYNPDLDKTL
ncbi:MAG TPA: CotH kinase family protein [Clostridia bacterium]|nr:CotH kinase family protein [Clostridia bacterium]